MNALNIKSAIIAALFLSFGSPLLRAVQLEPDPIGNRSEQVEAETPSIHRRFFAGDIIIAWSESNDELRGFTKRTGDWDIIQIGPQKEIVPVLSENMAAVRFGDSIAAFSGEKCRWDVIELSKDSKSHAIVGDSLVQIEDNGHLYTFAAEKAQWTSPTDPELQPATVTMNIELHSPGKASLHSRASTPMKAIEKWRDSLPKYKARGVLLTLMTSRGQGTADLWTARQSWMPELKSKMHEIFEVSKSEDGSVQGVNATTQTQLVTDLEQQIETLQVELNALRSTTAEATDAATKQPDKATLREQVEQAFDVRQQLQELEAQKLRLKLQLIEENLESRQKNRDGIIERRVEELLKSGFDSSSKQKAGNSATHNVELLVFTASYCGPCQQMTPILTRMTRDKFPVRILDITTETEQTRRFEIERIPTFVVTIDGKESRRFIGVQSETELRRAMNVSAREADSQKVTTSPVVLSGEPRLPAGTGETVRPFQKDPNPASATGPAIIQNTATAMTWKQPSEIISQLRKAQTMVTRRHRHQSQMKEWMRDLTEKKKSATPGSDEYARIEGEIKNLEEENSLFTDAHMDNLMRDWTQPWSEYQSYLRLLRLDVETAKASLAPLTQKHDQLKLLFETGLIGEVETTQAESEVQLAEIQLRRAEELLKLYTDIEKNEPQLNPDYKAPPADEWPQATSNQSEPAQSENASAANTVSEVANFLQDPEFIKDLQHKAADVNIERQRLKHSIARVETYEQPLKELISKGVLKPEDTEDQRILTLNNAKNSASENEARISGSIGDWKSAWSKYQVYVSTLRLDVEAAKASLVAIQQNHIKLQQRHRLGSLSIDELKQGESQVKLAKIQLRRAEGQLQLYADIEKNEPQLNPDYEAPPAEKATEAKPE